MNESELLWTEQSVIGRSFFENDEKMTACASFSEETFNNGIGGVSKLRLIMGLKEEDSKLKFHPRLEWDLNEPGSTPISSTSTGLVDTEYDSTELRDCIDVLLDKPYLSKGLEWGEGQVYVDFSQINWLDSAENPKTFNDLFYSRTKKDGGEFVRANQYGVSLYVFSKIKHYFHSIGEVQVLFGAHYGRVSGMEMMFTPILRLKAKVKKEHMKRVDKVLYELNRFRSFEGAHKTDEPGEIVYFNYLRPCPPYGNCGPG